MIRTLSLATVIASALALPVMAEDAKKIDPATSGPTSTMTDQTPQMKEDAGAANSAAPAGGNALPAAKAMGEATPSMKPDDALSGQADSKAPAGAVNAAAPAAPGAAIHLTSQEADLWIDKPVYSSDGKKLGEVVSFQRSADNAVTEMQADIGGFLGLGETRVSLAPAQFKLQDDRIVLELTADQVKALPPVVK